MSIELPVRDLVVLNRIIGQPPSGGIANYLQAVPRMGLALLAHAGEIRFPMKLMSKLIANIAISLL